MAREKAHFQGKEPFLEKILSSKRFDKVSRHIPPNSKVLDLGCGFQGYLLKNIVGRIESGIGLDIAVDSSINHPKINLREYNLNNPLPFCDNEFDIVTSLANLEHLENPEQSLSEIHRILKPGGLLLLTTPSTYGKQVLKVLLLLGLVNSQEIKDHKNYFNKKILLDYCHKIGFSSCLHSYFELRMNNFLTATK